MYTKYSTLLTVTVRTSPRCEKLVQTGADKPESIISPSPSPSATRLRRSGAGMRDVAGETCTSTSLAFIMQDSGSVTFALGMSTARTCADSQHRGHVERGMPHTGQAHTCLAEWLQICSMATHFAQVLPDRAAPRRMPGCCTGVVLCCDVLNLVARQPFTLCDNLAILNEVDDDGFAHA